MKIFGILIGLDKNYITNEQHHYILEDFRKLYDGMKLDYFNLREAVERIINQNHCGVIVTKKEQKDFQKLVENFENTGVFGW